ncbi:TIGR03086 family metal-binding protein [Actinoplanes sp. NPDC049316]|uniref:TIGR03086 family metal-binding protein n=1 Tax=Actinoplanes sp. NPDC049316 TaxID=3154727 RepID=UPI0034126F9C
MTAATVDQLTATAERVGRLVAGVKPDQWGDPTPCADWDVQSLVSHLVLGNAMVTSALTSRPMTYRSLQADFDESAATLTAAFRAPGVLERSVDVPFGRVTGVMALHLRLTELLVHGWDLARATGQPVDFAEDVIEQEFTVTAPVLAGMPDHERPFAAPIPVDESAPPLERLVARLGRRS